MVRRFGRIGILTLLAGLVAPARSDLVVLRDGTRRGAATPGPGQPAEVRSSRDPSVGTIVIDPADVVHLLSGAAEREEIEQLADADALRLLASDYHAAGLDELARRCLVRALERNPALAERPRRDGPDELRQFWNRAVLSEREAAAPRSDGGALLELARWARDAELADEAARLLRRAAAESPPTEELTRLAREWGVGVRPRFALNLEPALTMPLFVRMVMDEAAPVSEREGTRLLALPIRHRRDAAVSVRRGSFDLRAEPSGTVRFLGLRPMRSTDGRFELIDGGGSDPLYERMEIRPDERGRPFVMAYNTASPARRGGPKAESTARPPERLGFTGSGWFACIVEVTATTKCIRIGTSESPSQEIPLEFLEECARTAQQAVQPDSPALDALLGHAEAPASAIASFAVQRLAVLKEAVPETTYDTWSARVDPVLLSRARDVADEVSDEAWACLVEHRPVSPAAVNEAAGAEPAVQRAILRRISADFSRRSDHPRDNQSRLLSALLQSGDAAVRLEAVEILARGAPPEAYAALTEAPREARTAALAACEKQADPVVADRLLRPLLVRAHPADAERLAQQAARTGITVADAGDPVLLALSQEDPRRRAAALVALSAVDLRPVLCSDALDRALRGSMGARSPDELRRAAVRLAIEQAHRRGGDPIHGAFPVRLPTEDADPVVHVLRRAVAQGPDDLRAAAVLALVRLGGALAAEEALAAAIPDPRGLRAFVERLCSEPDAADCDGLFALLARLLGLADAETARTLFERIEVLVSRREADDLRVRLALKAGTAWSSLAEFSCSRDPFTAEAATRWALALGHLSPQDERQFMAVSTPATRVDRLREANHRLARIVSGRYEVILVLELCDPVRTSPARKPSVERSPGPPSGLAHLGQRRQEPSDAQPEWIAPRRQTIQAGIVELRPVDSAGRAYEVWRKERVIGRGAAQVVPGPPARPEDWLPALTPVSTPGLFSTGRGAYGEGPADYWLETGEPGSATPPGWMRIDVGDALREAVRGEERLIGPQPDHLVRGPFFVSVRYAVMGTYAGVAPRRREAPRRAPDGRPLPVLVNCAVLLEKISGAVRTARDDQGSISTAESPTTRSR